MKWNRKRELFITRVWLIMVAWIGAKCYERDKRDRQIKDLEGYNRSLFHDVSANDTGSQLQIKHVILKYNFKHLRFNSFRIRIIKHFQTILDKLSYAAFIRLYFSSNFNTKRKIRVFTWPCNEQFKEGIVHVFSRGEYNEIMTKAKANLNRLYIGYGTEIEIIDKDPFKCNFWAKELPFIYEKRLLLLVKGFVENHYGYGDIMYLIGWYVAIYDIDYEEYLEAKCLVDIPWEALDEIVRMILKDAKVGEYLFSECDDAKTLHKYYQKIL